jgi:putative copper export protein
MPILGDDPKLDFYGNAAKAIVTFLVIELVAGVVILLVMAAFGAFP